MARNYGPDLVSSLPRDSLVAMRAAADEILDWYRILRKTNDNLVGLILENQGTFFEMSHYPAGDVVDWDSHGQYYYHAHPKDERPGEHGHFHTFLRYEGMPAPIQPAALDFPQEANPDRVGSHLIAISMDRPGFPIKLFTTNRWVTDETWYGASDVMRMLEHFDIEHRFPAWPVNRWLSAMFRLFRPQMCHLLTLRDRRIVEWRAAKPGLDVFEDRDLEVVSEMNISVEHQCRLVDAALEAIAAGERPAALS